MAAGVSVFAALASSLAAFVVYHVVGLVVFLVSPLVTFSAVQIVVAAYTGLFFLAASKFVHRFIPS